MQASSVIDKPYRPERTGRRAAVRPIHPKIGVPTHWEDAVAAISLAFLAGIVLILVYQAIVF